MIAAAALSALFIGCPAAGTAESSPDTAHESIAPVDSVPALEAYEVQVTVTLDGVPVQGATVMQAGTRVEVLSGGDGTAIVQVDPSVPGAIWVVASHPDARNSGLEVEGAGVVEIALISIIRADNQDYTFKEAGPELIEGTTTGQCSHCHVTLHQEWYRSPHRTSASNPRLHDVYQGIASSTSQEGCGGRWESAIQPGTGEAIDACVVAEPVSASGSTGSCADCHAPGINGEVGGRDLLVARDLEFTEGVACDFCHHVESIHAGAAPGVGGWLSLLRPSEPSDSPVFGQFEPLLFGPYTDVVNPYMGASRRDHFHESAFCGGCHEQSQAVLVPAAQIDESRWPSGTLPIHTTYSEWTAGPMNPSATCQSCHMPPKPEVGNSADLHNVFDLDPGLSAGWERPPGSVRAHSWLGPRQPAGGMLGLAASVSVHSAVADGVLTAQVTVKNVGPGHAIPTGEPLRNLILGVSAACETSLPFLGGDIIPDVGGMVATRTTPNEFLHFPEAQLGMLVRFVRQAGWYDYQGYGPFGDGTFVGAEKGLPRWEWLGEGTVIAVDGVGNVVLDVPVPENAERAILVEYPNELVDGGDAVGVAAAPGFAFARVLVGVDGTSGVPHHLAVDVASDNRLLPQQSFTTEHRFAAGCDAPTVRATLVHRAYPADTARRYGWTQVDSVMDEARR